MDIWDIVALTLIGLFILGWFIFFLITYVIKPKQTFIEGLKQWWEDGLTS